MPIFEYKCRQCGRVFEEIVFGSDKDVRCPDCESAKVSKLISAPCSVSGGKDAGGGLGSAAPGCGGGFS
jgi:putative FmdB family regulatory protein